MSTRHKASRAGKANAPAGYQTGPGFYGRPPDGDQDPSNWPPARRWQQRVTTIALLVLLSLGIMPLVLRWWVQRRYARLMYTVQDVPSRDVAIVFGAGITTDGRPLPALADRVLTAVELYKAGKVKKLLLSGDNRFINYNEPQAMRELALAQGIPAKDLVLDYAGRRTYDTCYRAGYIFDVREAILVTQQFHLPRALYICDSLGINAVGVIADRRPYLSMRYWQLREIAATANAWLDLHCLHPTPVLGEKLPITFDPGGL